MGRVVPEQYRASFGYLFWDIAWYGLLGGSTITFLAIYLIRLGADPIQIGMLNAVPAISTLIFALPAGQFLARHRVGRAIFWSSAVSRVLYLVMIPLPLLLEASGATAVYDGANKVLKLTTPAGLLQGGQAGFAEPPAVALSKSWTTQYSWAQ